MTHCSRVHVHLFESPDNTENERKWKTPCALGQVPGVPCLPQFQVCLHSLEPCIPNNVPEWSFQRHGELMGSQSQSGHFRALQSSDSLSWNQGVNYSFQVLPLNPSTAQRTLQTNLPQVELQQIFSEVEMPNSEIRDTTLANNLFPWEWGCLGEWSPHKIHLP